MNKLDESLTKKPSGNIQKPDALRPAAAAEAAPAKQTKPYTFYIELDLHKALRQQVAGHELATGQKLSPSTPINEALREYLKQSNHNPAPENGRS